MPEQQKRAVTRLYLNRQKLLAIRDQLTELSQGEGGQLRLVTPTRRSLA